MIRLVEFEFIFYYLTLLAIAAQVDGGRSVLDITIDHCLKYCNQDCVKYSDSVLPAGKPLDNNAQNETEECELAQIWCECNPDPSTWGLDCRRHCHHCKLLIFTRRNVRCQEENRRCDCGPTLSQPGSGDNRLWASYGRPGISLWGLIVVLCLVFSCRRHLQAKNLEMEIGNRRRHVQNERHSCTNNTYCPPTSEPIIPRESSSNGARAEYGQQAPAPRPILLTNVAPPPEYEPPPPYPGIAKPGKKLSNALGS